MGPGAIGGIPEVELREHVGESAVLFRSQLGVLGDLGKILRAQLLEEVCLAGEKPRDSGIEVGSDAPDHAIELG